MNTLTKDRDKKKSKSLNALIERSKKQRSNKVERNLFMPHTLLCGKKACRLNGIYDWGDTVWYDIG
jgi:hypothetical protein